MMNSVIQTIGPVWTVRILTTFHFLATVFQSIVSTSVTVVNTIMHFLNGTSNRYVFLRGGGGPIPATMVPNYMTTPIVSWVYDSQTNSLYYMNHEEGVPIERNLPVLSMAVRTPVRTYSADEFAGMFTYSAPRNVVPNPRLLLYCWSIYSRVWTVPNVETGEGAVFSVITNEGETVDHPIFFRSEENIDAWDNLFHVEGEDEDDDDDNSSEEGDESGSESGGDEDGTDGDDEGEEEDGDVESESGDENEGEDEGDNEEDGDVESESGDNDEGVDGDDEEHGDVESESGEEDAPVPVPAPENATPTATTVVSDEEAHMNNENNNATPTVATELTD